MYFSRSCRAPSGWRCCANTFPTDTGNWSVTAAGTRAAAAGRGRRKPRPRRGGPPSGALGVGGEPGSRAKAAWARLIRKVYEVDPLECPKCRGPMRAIALIEDPIVVRAILEHLGRWQPRALERAPPAPV